MTQVIANMENTGQLLIEVTTPGVTLEAVSGHDYTTVPEPERALLLGVAALALLARAGRSPRRAGPALDAMHADRVVEFFFSPGSRYCYLAASQLPRIEAAFACRFAWRPVRGPEIRALRGRDPFAGEPVSGQYDWAYRRRDAEMWAELYGIPFREPPSHEFDFDLLARAAAAAERFGKVAELGWALCSTVYGSSTWPLDRDVCISLAEKLGLGRLDFAQALEDTRSQELLTANAREAHRRGAFGVPTLFLGDRMFWGNDRLALLEHALRR